MSIRIPISMDESDTKLLIDMLVPQGWQILENTKEKICFSFFEDEEHEWLWDFNKKTGRSFYMNGRTKVRLLAPRSEHSPLSSST